MLDIVILQRVCRRIATTRVRWAIHSTTRPTARRRSIWLWRISTRRRRDRPKSAARIHTKLTNRTSAGLTIPPPTNTPNMANTRSVDFSKNWIFHRWIALNQMLFVSQIIVTFNQLQHNLLKVTVIWIYLIYHLLLLLGQVFFGPNDWKTSQNRSKFSF